MKKIVYVGKYVHYENGVSEVGNRWDYSFSFLLTKRKSIP